MSKHDDDTCPHFVRASLLETENAHLNAEVKRLRKLESMIDPLKAEVERLRKFNDEALAHIVKEERKSRERLDMAQAEVERLRKAGDELHHFLIGYIVESRTSSAYLNKLDDEWTAAQEGKPSV